MNRLVSNIRNQLRPNILVAYIFLLGALIASASIMFAPKVWYWGERHEPHTRIQRVILSSGHTVTQTFAWEKDEIDAVMVTLDPDKVLPSFGYVILTINNGSETRTSKLNFSDIPKSGVTVFPISPPLQHNSKGVFELSLDQPDQKIQLMYQIDGAKYSGGELIGRNGDLAFQLRYKVAAISGNNFWLSVYALLILACGVLLFIAFVRKHQESKLLEKRDLTIALVAGLIVFAVYGFWLMRPGYWTGTTDFTKDISYVIASRDALKSFTWPLWSHITCGGMPLLGNPEGNTISLVTLLALVMNPEKAMTLLLAIEGGLSIAGTYLLARMLGLGKAAAILSGIIFSLSPTYAYRLAEGFTMIGASIAFTPWVLLGLIGAFKTKSPSWMLLSGLALTAMFLRGDVRVIEYLLVALVIWTIYEVLRKRSLFPIYALSVIAAVSFLFGSIKILAFLEQPNTLSFNLPTTVVLLSQHDLWRKVLFESTSRNTWIPILHGYGEMFGNFGTYIGVIPVVLAVVGLFLKKNSYRWPVLIIALFLLVIGEGTLYEHFLRHIPVAGSILRLPNRALNIFVILVAMLAGMGIQKTLNLSINVWAKRITVAVFIIFISFDLFAASNKVFAENFSQRITNDSLPTTNSGVLLRTDHLLLQVCGDQNIQPEFTKNIKQPIASDFVASRLSPNSILVSNPGEAREVLIRERYLASWIPSSGMALDVGDGSIRVVNPKQNQRLALKYTNAFARAEQVLFIMLCLTLASSFVYCIRRVLC